MPDNHHAPANPPAPLEPAQAAPVEVSPARATVPPAALTPEEQMALFEKELRENDWGHQPC